MGAGRDLFVFRKLVSILLDAFVDGVDILGLERGFANEQCIPIMSACVELLATFERQLTV